MRLAQDEDGVTPVVGTILVMAITVAGMAGILFWGAPAIQAIQDQGALAAMEGEFATLRESTLVLREIDSSRVPVIPVNEGTVGLEPGTRMVLHMATGDAASSSCIPNLTDGWFTGASDDLVLDGPGCGFVPGNTDVAVDEYVGGHPEEVAVTDDVQTDTITIAADDPSTDFTDGDWRITVSKGGDVLVYVFVIDTLRFQWDLLTQSSDMQLMLEGGALFRQESGRVFQLAGPPIQEDIFGTGDYLIRFPTYRGSQFTFGAPVTLHAQVQLDANHLRVANDETRSLRYSFHDDDLSEAWCNAILLRNQATSTGTYTEDPAHTCASGDANGIRSVEYVANGNDLFPFEFIHSRIHAALFL